jgi:uncharacterized protein (DUF1330 family)
MGKHYFVAGYTVTNPERYAKYPPLVSAMLADVRGSFGRGQVLEGEPAGRTVVLEFASGQAFDEWYFSEEYQRILPLRTGNSEGWAVVLEEWKAQ